MSEHDFDPYYKWLGIPAAEQSPHFYRLLGVSLFETDMEVIENAANRQIAHLRTCSLGPQGEIAQRILNEVTNAKINLLNASKKISYDAQLLKAGWQLPQDDASLNQSLGTVPRPVANQTASPASKPQSNLAKPVSQVDEVYAGTRRPQRTTHYTLKVDRSRRSSAASKSRKKNSSWFTMVGLILGGVSGICVAIVLLWLVAESDPLGLFTKQRPTALRAEEPKVQLEARLNRDGRTSSSSNAPAQRTQTRPQTDTSIESDVVRDPSANSIESRPINPAESEDLLANDSEPMSVTQESGPEPNLPNLADIIETGQGLGSGTRAWKLNSGDVITGTYIGYENDLVQIGTADGETRQITLSSFEEMEHLVLSDAIQFQKLPFGDGVGFDPNAMSLEESRVLHEKFPRSPYAGLLVAYTLSEKSKNYNDYKAAQNILKKTFERIQNHHQLVEGRHNVTLNSIHNNQAILYIRDHKFDAAATSFVNGIKQDPNNTVTLGNAYQLYQNNEQAVSKGSRGYLNLTSKTKLRKAVAGFQPVRPTNVWFYSFDVNVPVHANEEAKAFTAQHSMNGSQLTASNTWCITCKGKGAYACLVCRGDGVVSSIEAGTVSADAVTGSMVVPQAKAGRCSACTSGNFKCTLCNLGRIQPARL